MSQSVESTATIVKPQVDKVSPGLPNDLAPNSSASFWKSAVLLTLAFLTISFFIALAIPSRYLNAADGVTGTFRVLVTKLAAFLPSREDPDLVFLGSSLVLTPAVRCDDKMDNKLACYDRWYYDRYIPEYTQAKYFQSKLKEQAGLNFSVKNLGVASSIMSDQFGIYRLMLQENKHPKVVVLGLAPRDFLDNTQQKYLETPTRQFIKEYEQDSLLPSKWSAAKIKESAIKAQHKVEKVIARLRSLAVDFACSMSGHQAKSEIAVTTYVGDRPNRLKDLETYKKLYNPPNYQMLEQQSGFLQKLLVAAKNNGTRVVVVNMPLTEENVAALGPKAYAAYTESLAHLCEQYDANFLDIGTKHLGYSLQDFEDCCHLNGRGGEKFYASLIDAMKSDAHLNSSK